MSAARASIAAVLAIALIAIGAPAVAGSGGSMHPSHHHGGKSGSPTDTPRLTRDPMIVVGQTVMIAADSAFYPKSALEHRLEARGVVECSVTRAHSIIDCVVLAFAPSGEGFDAAALQRIASLRVRARDDVGDTAGRKVRFPIYFRLVKRGLAPSSLAPTGRSIGTAGTPPSGRH